MCKITETIKKSKTLNPIRRLKHTIVIKPSYPIKFFFDLERKCLFLHLLLAVTKQLPMVFGQMHFSAPIF